MAQYFKDTVCGHSLLIEEATLTLSHVSLLNDRSGSLVFSAPGCRIHSNFDMFFS